jgi:hypothetical protein
VAVDLAETAQVQVLDRLSPSFLSLLCHNALGMAIIAEAFSMPLWRIRR